jgi:hypothetical protein
MNALNRRRRRIALQVVHEDDSLIVLDKPAGLVVHPGSGNWSGTLLNALLFHAPQLDMVPRAGIVHRLDKDTTGLMVVAKTLEAQTDLVRQLQARSVKRYYQALVRGIIEAGGTVDAADRPASDAAHENGRGPYGQAGAHALPGRGALHRLHADRMCAGNRANAPDTRAHDRHRAPAGWRPGLRRRRQPRAASARSFLARRCTRVAWH